MWNNRKIRQNYQCDCATYYYVSNPITSFALEYTKKNLSFLLCRVTMEGMTNLTNGTGVVVTGGNGNSNVTTVANNGVDNGSQNGSTGSGRSTPSSSDSSPGKLFVGGLSWQTTPDKLRDYFGQFGTVTDVLVMKDPVTQVNK